MSMMNRELPFIRDMFDKIAPRYDFLNRTLSLHRDVYWRKEAVASLGLKRIKGPSLLDVACGTGDIAIEAVRQYGKGIDITGVDFSEKMLALGEIKIKKEGIENIHFETGNALALKFDDNTFDAVTIAFGIRNIKDRKLALREFFRSLKPGGRLAVLELSTPEARFFRILYMFYFLKVLPFVGGLFSKNLSAYQYLPNSVIHFPEASEFAETISEAGFSDVEWKKMTLGIVTLYTGIKKNNSISKRQLR